MILIRRCMCLFLVLQRSIQFRGSLGFAEADPQSDGPDLPTFQGERSASVPW